ncbi:hypothetical protein [Arthrobacter sp. NyZ413]
MAQSVIEDSGPLHIAQAWTAAVEAFERADRDAPRPHGQGA